MRAGQISYRLLLTGIAAVSAGACGDDRGVAGPEQGPLVSDVSARPFYYYQGSPVYLEPDSSRLVVGLKRGQTPETVDFLVRAIAGPSARLTGQIWPGVYVFDLGGREPGVATELLSRVRAEPVVLTAVPAYRWESDDVLITNELIVKFSATTSATAITAFADSLGLTSTRMPAPDSGRVWYSFQYPERTTEPLALVNEIARHPLVEWASPDMVAGHPLALPNDPYFPFQFHLDNPLTYQGKQVDVNPDWAWVETRGAGVTVAIIDLGVQVGHPDFSFSEPVQVFDAFGDPVGAVNPQGPTSGHGTAVAGIIFAEHNGLGVAGIAPDAHIAVARIFDDDENPTTHAAIAAAIGWAWSIAETDILNLSWGSPPNDPVLTAIMLATIMGRGGLGSIVVAGTGNDGTGVRFPASLSATVAVNAITRSGPRAFYGSVSGMTTNDLVAPSHGAPGEQYGIVTTDPTGANGADPGDFDFHFGWTSAAAPQVSGAAALVYARFPTLLQGAVRSRLTANADPWGPSATFGAGKLNASRAAGVSELLASANGPGYIFTKGSYTWSGAASGGIGGFSYQWRRRFAGGSWTVVGTAASLILMVYGGDGDFDLELRVLSGMQAKYDTVAVINCISGGPECMP